MREVGAVEGTTERFVHFLMGKSLVNPVRFVSISRLEISAATLAIKIKRVLTRELHAVFDSFHMWADSMVVLGYVRNRTTLFRTYVANKLANIHDGSGVNELLLQCIRARSFLAKYGVLLVCYQNIYQVRLKLKDFMNMQMSFKK